MPLVPLGQPCGEWSIGLADGRPKSTSNPLCNRRDGATPDRCGLTQFDRERCHQTAIAVMLLEKPFAIEELPRNPVQQVSVNLRTNYFHKVARQAVAGRCVYVQDTHARIKTQALIRQLLCSALCSKLFGVRFVHLRETLTRCSDHSGRP